MNTERVSSILEHVLEGEMEDTAEKTTDCSGDIKTKRECQNLNSGQILQQYN